MKRIMSGIIMIFVLVGCDVNVNDEKHIGFAQEISNLEDDDRVLYKKAINNDEFEAIQISVHYWSGKLYYFEDYNEYMMYSIIDNDGYEYDLKYAASRGIVTIEELIELDIPEMKSIDNTFTIDDKEYIYIYKSDDFNIYWYNCKGMCPFIYVVSMFQQDGKTFGSYSGITKSNYHFEQEGESMYLQEALDLHILSIDYLGFFGLYELIYINPS